MRAIMKSLDSTQCERIANGEQTLLLLKTIPTLETPFKCYLYCREPKEFLYTPPHFYTSPHYLWLVNGEVKMGDGLNFIQENVPHECLSGKVIGSFICDGVKCYDYACNKVTEDELKAMGMSYEDFCAYGKAYMLHSLHISNLLVYEKPREIGEFYQECKETSCGSCPYYEMFGQASGLCYGRKPLSHPFSNWGYIWDLGEAR